MTPIGKEIENVKAIGHASLSLFKAVIVIAIIAVVLGSGSTAQVIQQGFGLLAWLVSLVITPLQAGYNVDLNQSAQGPAGSDAASYQNQSAAFGGSPNDVSGTAMEPLFPGVPNSPQAPLRLPDGTMTPGGPVLNGIVPFGGF